MIRFLGIGVLALCTTRACLAQEFRGATSSLFQRPAATSQRSLTTSQRSLGREQSPPVADRSSEPLPLAGEMSRIQPLTLHDASWTFSPPPPPQEIRLHDIVSIRVDELARMQSEGDVQQRKNTLYDAILKDWIMLDGLRWVKPAPQSDGDPRVNGQLNQLYRAQAELETRESLAFNIAAEVVDIRPNGNLVLEANKTVHVNDETWEYSLSGLCRKEDIGPGNLIQSRNILHLDIGKRERGHVRDGYRRGWFQRWFDRLHPF